MLSYPGGLTSKLQLAALLPVIILLASCSTSRNSQYFNTIASDTTITGYVGNDMELKIRKGDDLGISITSLSMEENVKFNSAGLVGNNNTIPSYLVREDGKIVIYRLGEVMAEGYTRKELSERLKTALEPYLKEPIVTVVFLNHKVTVLGEVNSPQVITLRSERITLIDAIVMSGDLKEKAMRDKLMIIREQPLDGSNQRQVKYVSLEDHKLFSSEWFYLQPNDIVYVLADKNESTPEEKRRRLQTTLSLAASGLSLFVIILDRLIK